MIMTLLIYYIYSLTCVPIKISSLKVYTNCTVHRKRLLDKVYNYNACCENRMFLKVSIG